MEEIEIFVNMRLLGKTVKGMYIWNIFQRKFHIES